MTINPLCVTSWPPPDARNFGALPMHDALLLPSLDVYPRPGKEAADPLDDPALQLCVEALSSFRRGPTLCVVSKPASVTPGSEDYSPDAFLFLSGFANLDERIAVEERSERSRSAGREGNVTEHGAADKEPGKQEDNFDEGVKEAPQDEEQQCEVQSTIKIRYDIFPPPIDSPTICNRHSNFPCGVEDFHLESVKENGRFILRQRSMPTPHRYLRAERGDGRLRLQLVEAKAGQEQWGGEFEEEQEEAEVEEDGNVDYRQVEGIEECNVCDETTEVGDCKEFGNLYASAHRKGDPIQLLTTRSGNRVASWVHSRAFLLNRVRPLVY